jgi:hypothetical protein
MQLSIFGWSIVIGIMMSLVLFPSLLAENAGSAILLGLLIGLIAAIPLLWLENREPRIIGVLFSLYCTYLISFSFVKTLPADGTNVIIFIVLMGAGMALGWFVVDLALPYSPRLVARGY